MFPLKLLGVTLTFVFGAYLVAGVLARVGGARRAGWAIPHSRLGLGVMAAVNAGFLTLLTVMSLLQFYHKSGLDLEAGNVLPVSPLFGSVRVVWLAVLAIEVVFGLVYPMLQVTRASVLSSQGVTRKAVYFSFLRRYFGVQFGLTLCLMSIWVIGYRVLTTIYPWQLEILTTGLGEEERNMIQLVMSLLSLG